ncbi:MAG: glucose 1-dehydrogenase [Christensenellaceae bacterium]|nr:glucose 1-dehydrogenase [Christensenellaceae bacterium]
MKVDLTGKTAFVTGGYGVLGSAICRKLAENGANIVFTGRNAEKGNAFAAKLGEKALFIEADVKDREGMKAACAAAADKFGKVDILVNNAGIFVPEDKKAPLQDFDDVLFDEIIETDLTGIFNTTKPIAGMMRANKYGRIVNISASAGYTPVRNQVAFSAAKAGILHLTRAMAVELAADGIVVNAVCPGTIDCDVTKAAMANEVVADKLMSHVPMHRLGTPEEVANVVLMLASDEASYMTGNTINLDGGLSCGYARDY